MRFRARCLCVNLYAVHYGRFTGSVQDHNMKQASTVCLAAALLLLASSSPALAAREEGSLAVQPAAEQAAADKALLDYRAVTRSVEAAATASAKILEAIAAAVAHNKAVQGESSL